MVVRMISMAIWTITMVFLITMVGVDKGVTMGVPLAVGVVKLSGVHVGQVEVLLTSWFSNHSF